MNYLFLHTGSGADATRVRALAAWARGVSRRGHSTRFVVPSGSVTEAAIGDAAGRAVDVVPLELDGGGVQSATRIRSAIRRARPDVIVAQGDVDTKVASIVAGRRTPVIRRVCVGERIESPGALSHRVARITYAFPFEADRTAARMPRRIATTVVPIGVPGPPDAEPIATSGPREHTIVCVQDASSRSRAAHAVRTTAILSPRHAVRLLVLGDGRYDDDLRMQAAALNILPLVTFLGDRGDALEVMRDASIGWIAAAGDTAVLSALDFMSLGVPVLTGAGSAAERVILDRITGAVLPPEDTFIAASVAAELLSSETRRETMGAAAHARVQREFSEAAMIDALEHAAAAATGRLAAAPAA